MPGGLAARDDVTPAGAMSPMAPGGGPRFCFYVTSGDAGRGFSITRCAMRGYC